MPFTIERTLVLSLALAALTAGCGGGGGGSTDPGWEVRETTLLPPWEEGCTNAHVPIVMVHGFLASGDTYTNHLMRFTANGYCRDRIFVYDWNSLGGGSSPARLDTFVDEVLRVTGATQIDLMGHSAGGGIGYSYLEDATRAAKVRRYVHIGSGDEDAPAGPTANVPTLNLYSANDRVVTGNDGIDGAENVDLVDDDHYEVATSADSFTAIWEFLTDSAPTTTDIAPQTEPIVIAGPRGRPGRERAGGRSHHRHLRGRHRHGAAPALAAARHLHRQRGGLLGPLRREPRRPLRVPRHPADGPQHPLLSGELRAQQHPGLPAHAAHRALRARVDRRHALRRGPAHHGHLPGEPRAPARRHAGRSTTRT
jgi:triacylglycerol lipase